MNRKLAALTGALALGAAAVLAAQQSIEIVTRETVIGQGPLGPGGRLGTIGTGTGLIFGQAVEADSSRPIASALVTLSVPGTTPLRALADAQGRFAFRDLPKGRFTVTATKPGHIEGAYGRMRPGGPSLPVELDENERVSDINVSLWKYGVIAGTVVDEGGQPIVNTVVRTLRRTVVGGLWKLVPGPQDFTDDRGMYRIGMLEPGEYVVTVPMPQQNPFADLPIAIDRAATERAVQVRVAAVTASAGGGGGGNVMFMSSDGGGGAPTAGMSEDGRPMVYPTVFYPTAASAQRATTIQVGSGEEKSGVDFQLRPVRTVKLGGTAVGPEGPAANLQLLLVPAEAEDLVSSVETMSAFSDAAGSFTFPTVPPGQYTLRATRTPRIAFGPGETTTISQAGGVMVMRAVSATGGQPPLPTEPTLWAEMVLSVGKEDLTDLNVGLRPGVKVSGMVQFDGGTARPTSDQLQSLGVRLEPAESRAGVTPGRGRVEATGQFTTVGVPPGRYFLRVGGAPQGWTFRAATVEGRDMSDTPVELDGDLSGVILSFTDRPTELSGTVTVEAGGAEAATVLVFPADRTQWVGYGSASRRMQSTRASKNGNYKFTNLPPGDYLAIAIPDKMASDWQNPRFLESIANDATRVRIGDFEKAVQNLKVAR